MTIGIFSYIKSVTRNKNGQNAQPEGAKVLFIRPLTFYLFRASLFYKNLIPYVPFSAHMKQKRVFCAFKTFYLFMHV